jgi:hypothetical protein
VRRAPRCPNLSPPRAKESILDRATGKEAFVAGVPDSDEPPSNARPFHVPKAAEVSPKSVSRESPRSPFWKASGWRSSQNRRHPYRTRRAGYNCAHLRRFRGGLETAKEEGRSQSTYDLGSDEQRDINGPNPCKSVGERTCDCDCWVGERS